MSYQKGLYPLTHDCEFKEKILYFSVSHYTPRCIIKIRFSSRKVILCNVTETLYEFIKYLCASEI